MLHQDVFLTASNSRVMLTTNEQLANAVKTVNDYVAKGSPPVSQSEAEKIWDAKKSMLCTIPLTLHS